MFEPLVVHIDENDTTVLFNDMDKAVKYIVKYAKQTDIYDEDLQKFCSVAVCINDVVDILTKFSIQGIRVLKINMIDPEV